MDQNFNDYVVKLIENIKQDNMNKDLDDFYEYKIRKKNEKKMVLEYI